MAICAQTVALSGYSVIAASSGDPASCTGPVLLSSVEYVEYLTTLQNFGFDAAAFDAGVLGALTVWVTGVGIGLIIGQIRKMRMPT